MREAKTIDLLLLILLGVIWGSAFFNIKIATYSYEPFTLALVRVVFASIPLFILCKYKNIKIEAFTKNWKPYALIGLCNITIPFILIAIGTNKINSYLAAILMSTTPLSGSILAHFFTKDDRFTIPKLISICIGFVGVLFIFEIDSFFNVTSSNSIQLLSKLLIILAALGYMISNIVAYNTLKHIDSFSITFFATFFGALVSVPFLIASEISYPSTISFESVLPILYLGFFPTAIAFQLRYHITKTSGPVFLSYVAYLIPIFAIIWGYILLSENINYTSIIGIILILFGVYVGRKN